MMKNSRSGIESRPNASRMHRLWIHPRVARVTRILVPCDFSKRSREAIRAMGPFIRSLRTAVTLVHVVEPHRCPADYGYGPVVREIVDPEAIKRARSRLKRMAQRMAGGGEPPECLVLSGVPFFEITQAAKALESDLILMNHSGAETPSGVGRTTERVVRLAPCPVFVFNTSCRRALPRPAAPTIYESKNQTCPV